MKFILVGLLIATGTPGRYSVTTDISMAGPWKFMITFSGGETEFDISTP